jgi:cytidylate kinase
VIIAIDGPSSAGKTTLAKGLAGRLGILFLDTGATYRAAAYLIIQKKANPDNETECSRLISNCVIDLQKGEKENLKVLLDGQDITSQIRSNEVSDISSRISVHSEVRKVLVDLQRKISQGRDVVAEGRDTGSIVFPSADIKIYLDAPLEIRTMRRLKELNEMGMDSDFETVKSQLSERDRRDMDRKNSPLICLPEAIYINNGRFSIEETLESVLTMLPVRD